MSSRAVDRSPSGDAPTSRRSLLNWLLGGSLAGWAATALYPILNYLSPLPVAGNADEAELGDGAKRDLAAAGFAIVALGSERVIVFRDPQEKLRALSAKCTHEGCTVQYKADESIVWCACHNGRFDVDGRVLSGPPPRPLAPYKIAGSPESKLVVSRLEGA
jgi:Rieske Fe-S protein